MDIEQAVEKFEKDKSIPAAIRRLAEPLVKLGKEYIGIKIKGLPEEKEDRKGYSDCSGADDFEDGFIEGSNKVLHLCKLAVLNERDIEGA